MLGGLEAWSPGRPKLSTFDHPQERSEANLKRAGRRRASREGKFYDPDDLPRRGPRERGGRPQGSLRAYKGTHKPIEAPTLRRDPTATTKLAVVARWEQEAEKQGTSVDKLPKTARTRLEQQWHWSRDSVLKWCKLKPLLMTTVSRLRLGARGLRPFGSRAAVSRKNHNRVSGARMREKKTGIASKSQPLEAVMDRLTKWFAGERAHGHEVRKKTILTRLMAELTFERDRQLVRQRVNDEDFCAFSLRAAQRRLETFVIMHPSKAQDQWYEKVICPRISFGKSRDISQRFLASMLETIA